MEMPSRIGTQPETDEASVIPRQATGADWRFAEVACVRMPTGMLSVGAPRLGARMLHSLKSPSHPGSDRTQH